jgi:hypothetical protein
MPAAKRAKKNVPTTKKKAATKKAAKPDFAPVFTALRQLLEGCDVEIAVQTDKPGNYHTEMPSILHRGKPLYFAGVRSGKSYVSFHLLPIYYNAGLAKEISPALKKRRQGKACFNFTSVDEACFAELGRLVTEGLKLFKTERFRQSIQKMQ